MTLPHEIQPTRERGQVLFIFALALVAIVAMTGLVLDGGSTFVQRRDMQNAADAAAMAGAYDFANNGSVTSAIVAAQGVAIANGYTHGVNGVSVTVSVVAGGGGATDVTAGITKPHKNSFSGIVGLASWPVSTTATAETGLPNSAIGALPLIFNIADFPGAYGPSKTKVFSEPGGGNADVPLAGQFNWTVFCTANGNPCNANTNTVRGFLTTRGHSTSVTLLDLIGPLNAGAHTALFSDLAALVPGDYPVSIVDNTGAMMGFAVMTLESSVGGSTKAISGYFKDAVSYRGLKINRGGPAATTYFGTMVVRLNN